MSRLRVLAFIAAAALAPAGSVAAIAATAHNSQAGAYGSTKNACGPTPGFPDEGDCLSSAIGDSVDGAPPRGDRRGRYRPTKPVLGWPE